MMEEQEQLKKELKIILIAFQSSIISCVEERFNKKLDDMKERINELGLMIQKTEIKKNSTLEFMECSECAKKPGNPTLCPSCLNNRAVIEALKKGAK